MYFIVINIDIFFSVVNIIYWVTPKIIFICTFEGRYLLYFLIYINIYILGGEKGGGLQIPIILKYS